MTFEEYLIKKKIDSPSFRKEEPALWQEFESLFGQMHPESFTAQKLFLINPLRRRFPLQATQQEEKATKPKAARPVLRPKPKKED